MSTQQQQNLRARANGSFRIATSVEVHKSESPEENLAASSSCGFKAQGRATFRNTTTPIRPILYHACSRSDDNNLGDGGNADDNDSDVIFYKRYNAPDESDDGNNHEFDSQAGCSTCSASIETQEWRSCLGCTMSPQLSGLRPAPRRSPGSPALSDMLLESIEGPPDARNQQEQRCDQQRRKEDGEEELDEQQEQSAGSVEQPQQDDEEDKEDHESERRGGSSAAAEIPSNQFSVEPAEEAQAESPMRRRRRLSSVFCEPMVHYELCDSVHKSQQLGLSRFARRSPTDTPHEQQQQQLSVSESSFFGRNRIDEDDDFMNIRSPVNQKPSASTGASTQGQQQQQRQQQDETGWTHEQLLQYNDVLAFLQDACATRSSQISIPGTRLAQMEQLLRSLQPKA